MKALYSSSLVLLVIILFSCDGRSRERTSLKNAIENARAHMSSIETVEHKPTTYAEVKTDTVFNNGFTVKIKTYTDFNTAVVQIRKTASFAQLKTLHHPLISEITIEKDGILIFDKRIDRAFYTKHNALTAYTASNSITQAVTVNQEATSFETNAVYLSARYTYPDQNDSIEYELKVNATGHYSFKKLEYHTQTI